jgi:Ribosomal protein S5, C-terminal domain
LYACVPLAFVCMATAAWGADGCGRSFLKLQVATAIRGAIILAKMSVVPVRRGYWGNKIGKVHTVPTKVNGKCGSVTVRLVPAPRGAGIVAARVPKKVLQMAGIEDCYTSSRGSTKTLGNFVKVKGVVLGGRRHTPSLEGALAVGPSRLSSISWCCAAELVLGEGCTFVVRGGGADDGVTVWDGPAVLRI